MKKTIITIISVCAIAIMMTACGSKTANTDSNTIIMGTNAEFAPFEYREGKEVVGFDIEISEKIAENLGKELVIEDMEFGGLLAALETGKVDFVIAGMTRDSEREQQVDFSQPYYLSNQLITVNAEDDSIKGEEDLKGKKIGVQLGTTGESKARDIEGAEVVSYDKGAIALVDLANKKIDAVILDAEPTYNYTEGNEDLKVLEEKLTDEEYCIAVPKGNKELLDAINSTLDEIRESGEYDELINKYF